MSHVKVSYVYHTQVLMHQVTIIIGNTSNRVTSDGSDGVEYTSTLVLSGGNGTLRIPYPATYHN